MPAAAFGALFTLWLFHEELNIMGYVGIILLVGIVKKTAIMMIDFAIAREREQGAAFDAGRAIVEACVVRFRPIMMTTFAALAGAIPMALGLGAGADPADRSVWQSWAGWLCRKCLPSTSPR